MATIAAELARLELSDTALDEVRRRAASLGEEATVGYAVSVTIEKLMYDLEHTRLEQIRAQAEVSRINDDLKAARRDRARLARMLAEAEADLDISREPATENVGSWR